jgi:hypothetical protein
MKPKNDLETRIGRWPNPAEPGVPGKCMEDGFHWLRWGNGTLAIGMWSPDCWCWFCTYNGNFVDPAEMAHFDYVGEAVPPPG